MNFKQVDRFKIMSSVAGGNGATEEIEDKIFAKAVTNNTLR